MIISFLFVKDWLKPNGSSQKVKIFCGILRAGVEDEKLDAVIQYKH
jgi:hypothetical protein